MFSQAAKNIKEEDQKAFCEDLMEDLEEIDQVRIVGLGVNPEQLEAWIMAQLKT